MTSSKSEKTDIRRSVLLDNEQRHSVANVPMAVPKDAFQLVPGIFVCGNKKDSLSKLIEFFNVTHIVRCLEYEAHECKEDWLISHGGNREQPYGTSIPYPKNVFECPIRDSIDEGEFLPWASKASEFIANTLHIEEDEEIVLATTQAKEEGKIEEEKEIKEQQEQEEKEEKEKILKGDKHVDANNDNSSNKKCNDTNNDDDDQQEENKSSNKKTNSDEQSEEEEKEEECTASDPWAAYRERPTGAIVIHCEKGKSRSPAVAMAYLMIKRQMTLQEAMDLFEEDEDEDETNNNNNNNDHNDENNSGNALLQLNPVFVMELAKLEAQLQGSPVFDLDAYWLMRLQRLFPKIPTATVARELSAAGGNMLVAREKLMMVAARKFFDRDSLMVDALHSIIVKTVEDYRIAKNMRIPEGVESADKVVTKEECHKYFHENEKKRDVALMKLTQLVKQRMTIVS